MLNRNNQWWKQYVQHQVDEIYKLSDQDFADNPSDLPSRGCGGKELVESNHWWHGLSFISKQKEFWPHIITSFKSEEANQEKIKQSLTVIHSLASIEDSKHLSHDLEEMIDIK